MTGELEDNCGIFAFSGSSDCSDCFSFLETGGFNLQHRGQKFCGVCLSNGEEIFWQTPKPSLVKEVFQTLSKERIKGSAGMVHVGVKEPQPFFVDRPTKLGRFAVAFSGRLINQEELEKEYNVISSLDPSIQILAKIILETEDFVSGIKRINQKVRGGWAIAIINEQGKIWAARDSYGFRPLILGKSIDGCAVSSESVSLEKINMEIIRDVRPGEIITLEPNGFATLDQIENKRRAFCSFEWAYIAHISSIIEDIPVKRAREKLGAELAKIDQQDNLIADLVAAVPMSGIGYAIGYAKLSGIPYDEVLAWNRYSDRSYPRLIQSERDAVAEEKLSVISESIKGKKIVLLDDSIVRGTQIRKLIFWLKDKGAKEVHLRIACPPLIAPCYYNVSTRTKEELIANNHLVEEIGKMIGATTLRYNTIEAFVRAIGLPKNKLCLACFNGEYPDSSSK